jgi:hypothetical protein
LDTKTSLATRHLSKLHFVVEFTKDFKTILPLLKIFPFIIIVAIILSAPYIFNGAKRVLVSHNPSDALSYLTVSDSTLNIQRPRLIAGASYISSDESLEVINQSSTALYSARFVAQGTRLATPLFLALFHKISHIQWNQIIFFAFIMFSLIGVSAYYGFANFMGVTPLFSLLASLACIFSFWTYSIREQESLSQAQMMPTLTLFLFSWVVSALSKSSEKFFISFAILSGSAIICIYPEYFIALMALLFAGTLFIIFKRGWDKRIIKVTLVTLFGIFASLLVSGQFGYYLNYIIKQMLVIAKATSPLGSSIVHWEIISKPIHGIFGAWWMENVISAELASEIGVFFMFVFLSLLIYGLVKAPIKIGFTCVIYLLGLIIALFLLVAKSDFYSASKNYSTLYSFGLIAIAGFSSMEFSNQFLKRIILFSCASILAFNISYGFYYVINERNEKYPVFVTKNTKNAYDIESLTAALKNENVKNLLVNVPPDSPEWWHSIYLMLSVQQFNPYYQSGYPFDNNAKRLFHEKKLPDKQYDHILVDASDDYLINNQEAKLVYENGSLRLYRNNNLDNSIFLYRKREVK